MRRVSASRGAARLGGARQPALVAYLTAGFPEP